MRTWSANGRDYSLGDGASAVVICVDGSAPEYHERAVAAGRMPWLAGVLRGEGTSWTAHCALPALTNPNNLSIATGRPPAVHGISGNTWFDAATATEQPMSAPDLLRAPTLFAAAQQAGVEVAVVTAKDKLRRLLGAGLDTSGSTHPAAVCFSAERADLVGGVAPAVYSAELSEHVLAAGVRLLRERRPGLLYLSLSDYVQHKHAPGTPVADDFYAMLDGHAAALDALGATVVLTADHGMSAKSDAAGRPQVVHLEDEIVRLLGGRGDVHVVLPITDPYVAHHGALGSVAYVHLSPELDAAAVAEAVSTFDGIQATYLRADAARELAMPADRIGDVVVFADAATALGSRVSAHDLTGLDAPLRSHGGFGELAVPFLVNRRLPDPPAHLAAHARAGVPAALVHNYDAFHVATTLVHRTAAPAGRAVPAERSHP